jgi:murein DD-endopeptidase MepM/ murein hydrolase activator NlpD
VRQKPTAGSNTRPFAWVSGLLWFITVLMVVMLVWVVSQRADTALSSFVDSSLIPDDIGFAPQSNVQVSLPEFRLNEYSPAVKRMADVNTIIPERKRDTITSYVVEAGDSVFSISKQFNIKPETVLWANEDILQDNPNELSIGQKLKIPALDGVIYKWKSNDTIEGVARKFKTNPESILTWPDNNLDLSNPQIASGTMVMVPGGSRELRTWVVPTIWRANAGANRNIATGCDTSGATAYGTGTFMWPASSRLVSGNDYWSGHLGLDIGAAQGSPIYAADSGMVVYAAGISGGYGLMVMIDHGNGFHTLYAHLSQIITRCGNNVVQGQTIAYSGSTGNSTGPHLHFELRYNGAFVNPRDYLR